MTDPLPIDALEDLAMQFRERAETERRPRPARRPLLVLGPVAAVAVLAIVALLVLPEGGGRRDAVAQARAVLSTRDTILTYRAITTIRYHVAGQAYQQPPVTADETVWATTDRWRYLNAHYLRAGTSNGRQEWSYADGVTTVYTAGAHSQRITEGIAEATAPDIFGVGPDLRSVLARGEVKDLGTRTIAGRTVRRLRNVRHVGRVERTTFTITYDVDPNTFEPLSVRTVATHDGRELHAVTTATTRVVRFTRLPLTSENRRLLTIAVPAGTAVTRYRAFPDRPGLRKLCARPRRHGFKLCP